MSNPRWKKQRGDLVRCLQSLELFRITRLLSDYDTDTCWYVLQPLFGNAELLRSVKLVDDSDLFVRVVPAELID